MTDNDVITIVLNQGDLLAEILCDRKNSGLTITGELIDNRIRVTVDLAPEVLGE